VSFSILIGRNSVAEWLIVANTYHLNSDPNSILELFIYSCTMNISDIVNWRPQSERGSVYA